MNFYSLEFFGFFLITLILYYVTNSKFQQIVLFTASSIFIYSFSLYFLSYTFLFILFNYLIIRLLNNKKHKKSVRKVICNTGIGLNILFLVFYKYVNFLIDNLNVLLDMISDQASISNISLIIPIGISYFTFQGIGYILQVYREHETAEKNIFVFSNYFIFFPKFLSGPIEMSKSFIPQLKVQYSFSSENLKSGMMLILWGLFKKIIIADRLVLILNTVHSNVNSFSGLQVLLTFLIQPLHLYCDFSGYTDIALGIGRTFGFELTDNFNRPFFSKTVSEFWRRWHISLSSWCNEFIYKRLSFKLRQWGVWASAYAVFVTFIVIGLWHGPNWKYLVLGVLQGVAINYEFFTKRIRIQVSRKINPFIVTIGSYILTYLFMSFSLTFFYANNVTSARRFIFNLFSKLEPTILFSELYTLFDKYLVLIALILMFTIEFWQEYKLRRLKLWWLRPIFVIVLIYILLISFVKNKEVEPFIYTLF